MNTKMIMAAFFAAGSCAVSAATLSPTEAGDLSGRIWGGEVTPTSADSLLINLAGTYTASSDLSVSDVKVTVSDVVFDFTATPARTIDLASKNEFILNLDTPSDAATAFKGGTWNCSGHTGNDVCFYVTPANNKHRHAVTLSDGCTIRNLYRMMNRGNGLNLTLTGGSNLSAMELWLAYGTYSDNMLNVLEGSSVDFSSSFSTDQASGSPSATTGRHRVLVSGTGSRLGSGSGAVYVSYRYPGCSLTVTNGASLAAATLTIGDSSAHATNATVVIADGAAATVQKLVSYNHGQRILVDGEGTQLKVTASDKETFLNDDCELTVKNGASATFASYLTLNGGGRIFVSDGASLKAQEIRASAGTQVRSDDATLTVNQFKLSDGAFFDLDGSTLAMGTTPNISHARFRMRGVTADVTGIVRSGVNPYDIVERGSDGAVFEIADGAVINNMDLKYYLQLFSGATNDTLRITGEGSKLAVYDGGETFCFGAQANPYGSLSNVVEVSDGGCLDIGVYRHCGLNNTLVISNGTVKSSRPDGDFNISYRHPNAPAGQNPTNALVVMRGTHPKFKVEGKRIYFDYCSTLRFEIPEEGYADGYAPLEAYGVRFNSTRERLEVDCAAFAAKQGKENGKLVLVRNLDEDFGGTAKEVVAACAKTLPPKCRLAIEGREIVLRCPKNTGMTLIFR